MISYKMASVTGNKFPIFTLNLLLLVGHVVHLPMQCYSKSQQPTLHKESDTVCGKSLASANGSESTDSPLHPSVYESLIGSRPWLILVWVSCEIVASDTDSEIHPPTSLLRTCEGALIRKEWVLTASSCLWKCKSLNTTSITVDIGLHSNDIRHELSSGRNLAERISVERVFLRRSDSMQIAIPDISSTFVIKQGLDLSSDYKSSFVDTSTSGLNSGDIALLRLSRSVTDNNGVLALSDCSINHGGLYGGDEVGSGSGGEEYEDDKFNVTDRDDGDRTRDARVYLVSGWGRVGFKDTLKANILHDVRLELLPQRVCREVIGESLFHNGLFCAGHPSLTISNLTSHKSHSNTRPQDMKDVISDSEPNCFVQRGTPVLIGEEAVETNKDGVEMDKVCKWKLLGVLSFGMSCHGNISSSDIENSGGRNQVNHIPGIFTSVCHHVSWIETTIQQEDARRTTLIHCPVLPQPPPNGFICNSQDSNNSSPSSLALSKGVVEFCCDKGYILNGSSVSECNTVLGEWEPVVGPECVPVNCPLLSPHPHGSNYPENCTDSLYQTSCWFSCESGYKLSQGNGIVTCTHDGKWSSPPPSCIPVDCGPPPSGGSLVVSYSSTLVNATSKYTCQKCFEMIGGSNGSVEMSCSDHGRWSGRRPICKAVHCPPIISPQYGSAQFSSLQCGACVRYSCNSEFNLIGHSEAECLDDGTWSAPTPHCLSISCVSPLINDSNFAQPNGSYAFGTVIRVECDRCRVTVVDGVRSEDTGMLACMASGNWDKPIPSCQWATCPLPWLLEHGTIKPLGQLYFCGTTVTFSCDEGYRLNGTGANSSLCTRNGTWTEDFPTCEKIQCPIFQVPNGIVNQTGTKLGDTADVICDSCYEIHGTGQLTCLENGDWDYESPTCQLVKCSELKSLTNGRISYLSNNITQSSNGSNICSALALFTCDSGYVLSGPENITCTNYGDWSDRQPICKITECSTPPPARNNSHFCSSGMSDRMDNSSLGVVDQSLVSGSLVSYCCNEGYLFKKKEESGVLVCDGHGVWNGTVPICKPITCRAPLLPEHTILTQVQVRFKEIPELDREYDYGNTTVYEYRYGTRLTIGCDNDDYSLIGQKFLTCIADKQWSNPVPACRITRCTFACESPTPPINGRMVRILRPGVGIHSSRLNRTSQNSQRILIGDMAVFVCNRGYYLHGSGSRKCGSNGVWSGQEPLCLPFDQPRSRFIFRDPVDHTKWQTIDSTHFLPSDSLYLACQTHLEATGIALLIKKIEGPPIDQYNARIRVYGNPLRSTQLAIQPRNVIGGRSMMGVYLCQVQSTSNSSVIVNRTLTIHIHDVLCPTPPKLDNGKLVTMGTTPGSCLHYECNRGHTLIGSNDRVCLPNGTWTGGYTYCVSTYNSTCLAPNVGGHASITPPTSTTTSSSYQIGDIVTYVCEDTHTLEGVASRVCLGENRWSGVRPKCVMKSIELEDES